MLYYESDRYTLFMYEGSDQAPGPSTFLKTTHRKSLVNDTLHVAMRSQVSRSRSARNEVL